tara:strand:+ start:129 stop:521 length:393 start_codon:yes stop_codon:yes gene_type:complete
MKQALLKILALLGVIVIVTALWPIFTQAETSLKVVFLAAAFIGVLVAVFSLFSRRRWLLWAALGVWPGALVGGLMFAGVAMLTGKNRTMGWEGVMVALVIVLGVFIGAVTGGIVGGILGARKTCRENASQ